MTLALKLMVDRTEYLIGEIVRLEQVHLDAGAFLLAKAGNIPGNIFRLANSGSPALTIRSNNDSNI